MTEFEQYVIQRLDKIIKLLEKEDVTGKDFGVYDTSAHTPAHGQMF